MATTANPAPAWPARAASIVALRASRFVCSAIEVISLTTLPISALDAPSRATVSLAVPAATTASWATAAASPALAEISRIDALICSAAVATVSTLRDTCVAAVDTSPARPLVSSALPDMRPEISVSSSDASASVAAVTATVPISWRSRAAVASSRAAIRPSSSADATPVLPVRSPVASLSTNVSRRWIVSRSRRMTASARATDTAAPTTTPSASVVTPPTTTGAITLTVSDRSSHQPNWWRRSRWAPSACTVHLPVVLLTAYRVSAGRAEDNVATR